MELAQGVPGGQSKMSAEDMVILQHVTYMKPKSNFIPSFLFVSWCEISHLWHVSAQNKKLCISKHFSLLIWGLEMLSPNLNTLLLTGRG